MNSNECFKIKDPITVSRHKTRATVFIVATVMAFSIGSVSETTKTESDWQPTTFVPTEVYNTDLTVLLNEEFAEKAKVQARLEYLFADLQRPDWDGYGAYPLEEKSYHNVKALIAKLTGKQLSHWNLFPAPNGTFILTLKSSDIATINIGNSEISYAAVNGETQLTGKELFDAIQAANILKHINAIFKYA